MAAKLGFITFVVFVAAQANASCILPPPPPSCVSLPSYGSSATYVTAPAAAPAPVYLPAPAPAPVYVGSGGYYSAPAPAADCSVPPVYLPPPKFPQLPTIHAPNPLTIPLQVPSVIPVGKVCVCKAIQIQPSVIPVAKPCACKPACIPTY